MFRFKMCKVSEMLDQLDIIFDEMMLEMNWEIYQKELEAERC